MLACPAGAAGSSWHAAGSSVRKQRCTGGSAAIPRPLTSLTCVQLHRLATAATPSKSKAGLALLTVPRRWQACTIWRTGLGSHATCPSLLHGSCAHTSDGLWTLCLHDTESMRSLWEDMLLGHGCLLVPAAANRAMLTACSLRTAASCGPPQLLSVLAAMTHVLGRFRELSLHR